MIAFKIDQNSLVPVYQATLLDSISQSVDLTAAASVTFKLQRYGSSTLTVDAPATVVDAAAGMVQYNWQAGDTDALGVYLAWWDVDGIQYPSENADLIEIVTGPNVGHLLEGPCSPWTTVSEVRATCLGLPVSGASGYATDELIQTEINVASDLLYVLTGQQFAGECVHVLRPCRSPSCFNFYGDPSGFPPTPCGCRRLERVDLGVWPVTNVLSVTVDGETLLPSQYRLDQQRFLVRVDGDPWPSCQRLDLATTEADTFEVIIEAGSTVPPAGRHAASRLACELVKSASGQACQLPARAQSVNRQQITFTMVNASMLENGMTGVWDVDLFVMAYNPTKARGQTVVWSPDLDERPYRAGS